MRKIFKLTSILLVACLTLAGCSKEDDTVKVSIEVRANNADWGTVSGGGTYDQGTSVTLTATPTEGYRFVRWSDGNTENPRTITANESNLFEAIFAKLPEGDGKCTVTWNDKSWEPLGVYLMELDEANGLVTLELYYDPSDENAPMVVVRFPLEPGTYSASQTSTNFMILYFDYPSQTGTYNGQTMPPYQPLQGSYMTVESTDVATGTVEGTVEANFVFLDQYSENPDSPDIYSLRVDFDATQWVDMRSK